jgi:uncharacterized protein with FMN-binding domain
MKRILRSRTALATAASLSLIGALAGCASTTSADSDLSSGTSANSTSDNTTSYKDGTYSADSAYAAPGGDDEIAVTVTVRSNLITAVKVTTVAAHDEGVRYAAQFEAEISSVAVGKSLATLTVANVAGSSLTSQGFDSALATIRGEAKA